MYAKIFSQIFDSSIAEDHNIRWVFMDLCVLADAKGAVDMTLQAVSRRTNVPIEIIAAAIEKLSQPDPNSRTPDADGRRLVLLNPSRAWGWQIVNHELYRNMRDESSRRDYIRGYMRERRKQPVNSVNSVNSGKPLLTHTEAEAEAEAEAKEPLKAESKREVTKDKGVNNSLTGRSSKERTLRNGSANAAIKPDPRHREAVEALQRYWDHMNPENGVKMPFDGKTAAVIKQFLGANPLLSDEQFQVCLQHRADSPGTPPTEDPVHFIPYLLRYHAGPIEFGRLKKR